MKQFNLLLLVLFASLQVFGQSYTPVTGNFGTKKIIRTGTTSFNLTDSLAFNGNRPITLPQLSGVNPGTTTTMQDFLNALFYPSQPPTAAISGGVQQELKAPGTTNVSASWAAGRQASTATLATITVDGESKSFTQPGAPGSTSGTHPVTLTNNTNKSVTISVTTTDGKSASATTTWSWAPRRYWGRTANTAATPAEILASAGGGSELSNSKNKNNVNITASGSNRFFYAYPSSLGNLTSAVIGGLESIETLNLTVVSFTNASGYTQNYNVYTSTNSTAGNVSMVAQ